MTLRDMVIADIAEPRKIPDISTSKQIENTNIVNIGAANILSGLTSALTIASKNDDHSNILALGLCYNAEKEQEVCQIVDGPTPTFDQFLGFETSLGPS
ncbi:hypothetical protein SS1G_10902 [Sclerotinia sclerotiorum 1980 UF-70]|uniref:Uncharacterized protein n=1 Tax=Sclerotinia sclerotiorum (strain ATCC 18683 / 1980 / Ss-1) TaxID=665079 RepID=A7EZY5_SCLS1|nr:hypothetical protein SS1G_10902 [Sclerotinia sclerotiorum 1980 UF-70]EDN95027.1 hypothetical protein SS1G_10902 [Sclerotinia sclerotiorum 1980 UF-70]